MIKVQRSIAPISFAFLIIFSALSVARVSVSAQALNAGTISGVVTDPDNAVVPNATVTVPPLLSPKSKFPAIFTPAIFPTPIF